MKIATWNVNSIRARQARLLEYLESRAPDVLCLQETKVVDKDFPVQALKDAGYHAAFHGQKTYNGVAILAKTELSGVVRGLSDGGDDAQARVLSASVAGVRVISVYIPNGQAVGSSQYEFKLAFYARLRRYLDERHSAQEPLVLCGDFNVAPEERDVHDPLLWEGQTLFTLPERKAWGDMAAFGLTDTFRQHHEEGGRYSWWDYRMLAFPKNKGLRIDHLLVTPPLRERCVAADIDREARKGAQPSDHAPVWADFR